jgi:hypothetical protein
MIRKFFGFFILPLVFCSCMQTENSSSRDADTYGSAGSSAVKAVFKQSCTPCHTFESMSADDLVAGGYLVKGDAANSAIYFRIIGSTSARGPKDMPQGGAVSASDLAIIESWIAGL